MTATQPDLFSVTAADVVADNGGRVRSSDPETSKEAAHSVKAGSARARILLAIDENGFNGFEASVRCGITRVHAATSRLTELEALGLVHRTGVTRPTDTNHQALVFFVTAEGRKVASDLARSAA